MKNHYFVYLLVFLLFTSCESKSQVEKRKNQQTKEIYYPVTKIVDGDTFWIDNGSEKGEKIRLIGIDAPESQKRFKRDKGYFGKESKEYLTSLLKGKKVRIEYDVTKLDRFGRTLAYVYLQDGTFVNAELVKSGYAVIMTIPPNVKYAEWFLELQVEAREKGRGLWKE